MSQQFDTFLVLPTLQISTNIFTSSSWRRFLCMGPGLLTFTVGYSAFTSAVACGQGRSFTKNLDTHPIPSRGRFTWRSDQRSINIKGRSPHRVELGLGHKPTTSTWITDRTTRIWIPKETENYDAREQLSSRRHAIPSRTRQDCHQAVNPPDWTHCFADRKAIPCCQFSPSLCTGRNSSAETWRRQHLSWTRVPGSDTAKQHSSSRHGHTCRSAANTNN
jgi:hypothetical protein